MMKGNDDSALRFLRALGRPWLGEELFDAVPDTVFFVKDEKLRYVAANRTLAVRAGLSGTHLLIGRTAAQVFPGVLGTRIEAQDHSVIRTGKPVRGALELHLYAGGSEGWCLTWKEPLRDPDGRIVGLAGLSRDLQAQAAMQAPTAGLSRALAYVHGHLDRPLRLAELAAMATLSVFQFDQRIRALYGMSAGQYITRARIDLACALLRGGRAAIGEVALDCGYGDQAAFTRQFRKSVGLTPRAYREAA